MSYLLFIDESGKDRRDSPYEVLAGVAVHDTQLWDLICDVEATRIALFGSGATPGARELKARELLKRKTFKLAGQMPAIPDEERQRLVSELLTDPEHPTRARLTALGQAKIAYVGRVLELCGTHNVRFFASIVHPDAPRPAGRVLRKDYAYLFERYFYFVDEQLAHERGLVVFDELDRTQSAILAYQMAAYFRETGTGRMRSGRIIPEPFFVHSDLTTGVQIADLVAYIVAWNVRFGGMHGERREELNDLGEQVMQLRYRSIQDRAGYAAGFVIWSFTTITDLRPLMERWSDES